MNDNHSPPAAAQSLTDIAISRITAHLLNEVENRIKALIQVRGRLVEHSNDMEQLIKRYFMQTSVLDKIAKSYENMPMLRFLFVLSASILLSAWFGALFHAAALCSLTTLFAWGTIHFTLSNHASVSNQRQTRVCEDVKAMEERLTRETTEFETTTQQLNTLLLELINEIRTMNQANHQLEASIQQIQEQHENTTRIINLLNQKLNELMGVALDPTMDLEQSLMALERSVESAISLALEQESLLANRADNTASPLEGQRVSDLIESMNHAIHESRKTITRSQFFRESRRPNEEQVSPPFSPTASC